MRILCFVLSIPIVFALNGKSISDDVVALLGIPYARRPIGKYRFEESSVISLDPSASYVNWPSRCIVSEKKEQTDEDCLYLNVFRKKTLQKAVSTLLIVTNEGVDEGVIASLVTDQLTVVVASIRDGVLGSFGGGPFGVSDVISLVSFLKENGDLLLIDDVTIWAEGYLAETVSSALHQIEVKRAILINGNAATRLYSRDHYAARATYKLRTDTMCDLPSFSQSVDCLRSKSIEEILEQTKNIMGSFQPFGSPFRAPRSHIPEKSVPTILGLHRQLNQDYPQESQFDEKFCYKTFKRFLAGLLPDSLHRNAPLLRRMVLHQYIHSRGDKKDTYHLFTQMRNILLDRDYRVTTQRLVDHLMAHKNQLWLMEYGIEESVSCLKDSNPESPTHAFCTRLLEYFTRFAVKGEPTAGSCDPLNPTFPMLGSSKRDYHIILPASGIPEWEHNFHRPAVQLWNSLIPALDILELAGRRDSLFPEEQEIDPLLIEDDIQMWHERASDDTSELTEEQALNDMPEHLEL